MPIAIICGTDSDLSSGKGQLLLTRTQAAARLGVTERLFKKLVANADLSPYEEKLFNIPLYQESDIEELRKSRLRRY
jgi:hypothetical protein